jgi:putative phosphoesterase
LKIGIISDTHDDVENVQSAIEIFNTEKVTHVIHAGDYIFPGIILEFKKLEAKLIGVLGNNDGERVHLLKNFLNIGAELKGELGEIELGGVLFGIYHGTDEQLKRKLVDSGKYDVIITGHTHRIETPSVHNNTINLNDEKKQDGNKIHKNGGPTLVLNPGTAHRKVDTISGAFKEGGLIIFDTETMDYKFVNLPR